MEPLYTYDWFSYGALVLRGPYEKEVYLQGDEASDLYDQLENAPDEQAQQRLMGQYFDL